MLSSYERTLSQKPLFQSHHTQKYHITLLVLILTTMTLTIARLPLNPGPTTRADTIAIVMGIKSLLFLLYQHLTSPTHRLARFHSLKTNTVLAGMEIVFWAVVFGLSCSGVARGGVCEGAHCGLGAVVVLLALGIVGMEACLFVVSWLDWRCWKDSGKMRGEAESLGV